MKTETVNPEETRIEDTKSKGARPEGTIAEGRIATVADIVASYDTTAPLAEASTIPAPWYVDARIAELERQTVFSRSWQVMGQVDQVAKPGQFVTAQIAGEPLVAVRGNDGVLRAFSNVCRHHAAAVVTELCGQAAILHCPYHGWNYGLDGSLKGMPEFEGVRKFERQENGLVPVKVETWEQLRFCQPRFERCAAQRFPGEACKASCAARLEQAALLHDENL